MGLWSIVNVKSQILEVDTMCLKKIIQFTITALMLMALMPISSFAVHKTKKRQYRDDTDRMASETLIEHGKAYKSSKKNPRVWTMREIPQRFLQKMTKGKSADEQIEILTEMSRRVDDSLEAKGGLLNKFVKNPKQRRAITSLGEKLRGDLDIIRQIPDEQDKKKALYRYYSSITLSENRVEVMRRELDDLRRAESNQLLAQRIGESEITKGIDMNDLSTQDLDYLMTERYGDTMAKDSVRHKMNVDYKARTLEKMIAHVIALGSYLIFAIIVSATIATIAITIIAAVIALIAVAVVLVIMLA